MNRPLRILLVDGDNNSRTEFCSRFGHIHNIVPCTNYHEALIALVPSCKWDVLLTGMRMKDCPHQVSVSESGLSLLFEAAEAGVRLAVLAVRFYRHRSPVTDRLLQKEKRYRIARTHVIIRPARLTREGKKDWVSMWEEDCQPLLESGSSVVVPFSKTGTG